MMRHTKYIDSILELILVQESDQLFHFYRFGVGHVSPGCEDLFSFCYYEVIHYFLCHLFYSVGMKGLAVILINFCRFDNMS